MNSIIRKLDTAIKAVCPIDGVSIGHVHDKSKWRVDFKPEATVAQKLAAQAVVDAFDIDAPDVPQLVTMRQARLALLQTGLLASVQAAVDGMPGDDGTAARIEWEYSTTLERGWPLVTALSAQLNLSDADLDQLFALASSL